MGLQVQSEGLVAYLLRWLVYSNCVLIHAANIAITVMVLSVIARIWDWLVHVVIWIHM